MTDLLFKTESTIFDVRAVGVLVREGKLLVQRDKNGSEYALPGGHVQLGETTADALVREFEEETGAKISCDRLLWTEECFWEWNGRKAHNLAYYYLVKLCNDAGLPETDAFVPHRDNANVEIGWMPLEQLQEVVIYPAFLKQTIHQLDGPPQHFVSR